MSKVQIEGFNTFVNKDGSEELIYGVRIDLCEDTGNYNVSLIGKEPDGIYIIDYKEFLNFKEVMVYLQYLGRDFEYMINLLDQYEV